MKNYSIVRIGNEYVVQAGEKSILKVASRRRAAKLVTDAVGLMDLQPSAETPSQGDGGPSISRDQSLIPDPSEVP